MPMDFYSGIYLFPFSDSPSQVGAFIQFLKFHHRNYCTQFSYSPSSLDSSSFMLGLHPETSELPMGPLLAKFLKRSGYPHWGAREANSQEVYLRSLAQNLLCSKFIHLFEEPGVQLSAENFELFKKVLVESKTQNHHCFFIATSLPEKYQEMIDYKIHKKGSLFVLERVEKNPEKARENLPQKDAA